MMDEHDLVEALDGRAADVVVGPAPVDLMTAAAARSRRRRGVVTGLAAAAAVVLVTVGVAQAWPDEESPQRPSAAETTRDVPPEGYRYVGMGSAAIAVPEEWPQDVVDCTGSPRRTTVSVDTRHPVTCAMITTFPADIDAIAVESLVTQDTAGWTQTEVDGVAALRSPEREDGRVASAGVAIPSAGVVFLVSSSIDASHVDDLLDRIVVLREHVGVPGLNDLEQCSYSSGDGSAEPGATYLQRVEDAGLVAEVVEVPRVPGCEPGAVSVSPEPGTILEAGATVRVTVSR